jgi:hypothetical protein
VNLNESEGEEMRDEGIGEEERRREGTERKLREKRERERDLFLRE